MIYQSLKKSMFILLCVFVTAGYADENKKRPIYVGIGSGFMQLEDSYSKESFETIPIMFQIGYRIDKYLAIEARYVHDITVKYDGGNSVSKDDNDFPTTFTNASIYIKPIYPVDNIELYALLGYAKTSLSDIKGADRIENSFAWGLGFSYRIRDDISIFVDYTNVYDDKGFDGRATQQDVSGEIFGVGVSYVF